MTITSVTKGYIDGHEISSEALLVRIKGKVQKRGNEVDVHLIPRNKQSCRFAEKIESNRVLSSYLCLLKTSLEDHSIRKELSLDSQKQNRPFKGRK